MPPVPWSESPANSLRRPEQGDSHLPDEGSVIGVPKSSETRGTSTRRRTFGDLAVYHSVMALGEFSGNWKTQPNAWTPWQRALTAGHREAVRASSILIGQAAPPSTALATAHSKTSKAHKTRGKPGTSTRPEAQSLPVPGRPGRRSPAGSRTGFSGNRCLCHNRRPLGPRDQHPEGNGLG